MKTVHSVQSVRKLLERQGIDPRDLDPLKISIVEDKYDIYYNNESKLPFLHSPPLV